MLSLFHANPHPLGRRDFLRLGGLGLGATGLSPLWAANELSSTARGPMTGKSVVFLFMQGGPSQFETFDPKTDIPTEMRTVGDVAKTTIPGVAFAGSLSRLAQHAHRLAIVRSFYTGTGHGGMKPIVSSTTRDTCIGAIYSRLVGATNPETGLPSSAFLKPKSVDPRQATLGDRFGKFDATGFVGGGYAPFTPGTGTAQDNLKLKIAPERLAERRYLLEAFDQARFGADRLGMIEGMDGLRAQAFDVLRKGVIDAFDLSREDPRTLARYDTSPYFKPKLWGKKNNAKWYTAHIQTVGKLMLLARRLCEAGCGMITIHTEFVWDMHSDANNVDVKAGQDIVMRPFDHAVSAFIEDVEARGLSDRILLVCCGEMGRTPKLSSKGGRGHWSSLAPLMLYGGGLTHGQVVGASTHDGGKPATKPLGPDNLLATLFRTLIDHGQARLVPGVPAELLQILATVDRIPGIL
jgi:hypothetical protein